MFSLIEARDLVEALRESWRAREVLEAELEAAVDLLWRAKKLAQSVDMCVPSGTCVFLRKYREEPT